jgi:hypothetical protein
MTNIHADQNLRLAQKMLEQQGQINALTAALTAVTHEWQPTQAGAPMVSFQAPPPDPCLHCGEAKAAAQHRTPARVLAGLDQP